jgi:hypothetical protein
MAATEKVCARPPTPQASCVHQIHATGGVGGFTAMVVVLVMLFVLFVCFLICDSTVVLVVHTF